MYILPKAREHSSKLIFRNYSEVAALYIIIDRYNTCNQRLCVYVNVCENVRGHFNWLHRLSSSEIAYELLYRLQSEIPYKVISHTNHRC